MNLNGIVGDNSGSSSTACTNGKVLAANGGCGIKCDASASAAAPNGYEVASGSSPQEVTCSASNSLSAITLSCRIKPPSYPFVTITAGDGTNALSSGAITAANSITFTFTLKDGGGNTITPQLGSAFAIADVVKANCDGSSVSSVPHKLVCSKNTDKAITVQTVAGAFLDNKANAALASSVFTINSDVTKPTVTITATDAANQQIANGAYDDTAKITFSFALSDTPGASSSFVTGDVTKTQCDNPAFSGSGQAYKLICDAKNGQAVTAKVEANKYKDAAGNDNVASTPTTFTVNSDTTAPTVTISAKDQANGAISSGTYNDATTISFFIVLSEAPAAGTSFVQADVTATNCISPSSGQWTVTDTKNYILKCLANDGNDVEVKVGTPYQFPGMLPHVAQADGFTDAAGKENAASNVFVVKSDTSAPTVTITATDAANQQIANGAYDDTAKITFSFALSDTPASSSSFVTGDVTKSNCDNPAFSGSGQAYKLICDAKSGSAVAAGVGASTYKDAAGLDNVVSTPGTFTVNSDTAGPTVTISATDQAGAGITSGTANDASVMTFTFTLNEVPVPDATFTESDITKAHCTSPTTASTFKSVNANKKVYTLECLAKNGNTITMAVGTTKFVDAAGNANVASTPNSFSVPSDTSAPTVSISATDGSNAITSGTANKAAKITFSFTLSDTPGSSTSFVMGDLTAVNCDSPAFAAVANTASKQYTYICTAAAGASRITSVKVAAGKFKDTAGNDNVESSLFSVESDKTGTTIAMTAVDSAGGNIAHNAWTSSNKIRFIFTLNELSVPSAGFAIGDLTIGDKCTSATRIFEHQGSTKYSLECDANDGQSLTVALGATKFVDAANNANAAAVVSGTSTTTMIVKSDITKPTVAITASDGTNAITSGRTDLSDSLTFTFVLSEAAVGNTFVVADITKTDCSGSSISGSGTTWKLVCNKADGKDISVAVGANQFTDAAGNGNVASDTFVITSDTTKPTVTITASDTSGPLAHNGFSKQATVTWTFALSEPARNLPHSAGVIAKATDLFTVADVTKTNCANPVFTGADLLYYLRCDGDGSAVTVSVNAGSGTDGFKDAAGNFNAAGSALKVTSDVTPPTVAITALDAAGALANGAASLKTGTTAITFSFTLSETPTGNTFAAADITMVGCNTQSSLATVSSTADKQYKLTCAANTGVDISAFVPANGFTDAAGNGNTAGTKLTVRSDTTRPAVTITAIDKAAKALVHNDGSSTSATFKFTLTEPTSNFAIDDVTNNCPGGKRFYGTKYEWYLYCPHQEGLTVSISVAQNKFSDLGGLLNTASNTLAVKFS